MIAVVIFDNNQVDSTNAENLADFVDAPDGVAFYFMNVDSDPQDANFANQNGITSFPRVAIAQVTGPGFYDLQIVDTIDGNVSLEAFQNWIVGLNTPGVTAGGSGTGDSGNDPGTGNGNQNDGSQNGGNLPGQSPIPGGGLLGNFSGEFLKYLLLGGLIYFGIKESNKKEK